MATTHVCYETRYFVRKADGTLEHREYRTKTLAPHHGFLWDKHAGRTVQETYDHELAQASMGLMGTVYETVAENPEYWKLAAQARTQKVRRRVTKGAC